MFYEIVTTDLTAIVTHAKADGSFRFASNSDATRGLRFSSLKVAGETLEAMKNGIHSGLAQSFMVTPETEKIHRCHACGREVNTDSILSVVSI